MEKISYRLVYNRKNSLNDKGMALIQVEAYYKKKNKNRCAIKGGL